jgi:hypothetical protein
MIAPGTKIGFWTVVKVDDRRTLVECICGNAKAVFTASLVDGSCAPSCGCRPLSREQLATQRQEQDRQQRQKDLTRWRPEGRS